MKKDKFVNRLVWEHDIYCDKCQVLLNDEYAVGQYIVCYVNNNRDLEKMNYCTSCSESIKLLLNKFNNNGI